MLSRLFKRSFSTYFMLAGSSSFDRTAARLMTAIRTNDPNAVFQGIGGPKMQANKLIKIGDYKSSDFLKKPWTNRQNWLQVTSQFFLCPYSLPIHLKNRKLLKSLQTDNALKQAINRADAFIFLDNQILTKRFSSHLTKTFKQLKKIKPPTFFVNLKYDHFGISVERHIDHIFSFLPRRPLNWQFYGFPATTIGYQGLYKAVTLFCGEEAGDYQSFNQRLKAGVLRERQSFRTKYGIPEDKFVIYVAPGSTVKQAQFTVRQVKKIMKEYLSNTQRLKAQSFNFVVSMPSQSEPDLCASIQAKCQSLSTISALKIVKQQQRHSAMAASDFGIIFNGEMAVEAAACQLPSMTVENMSFAKAYFENLYNRYTSPLNISLRKLGFTEFKCESQCAAPRMAQLLHHHIYNPKTALFYNNLYNPQIFQSIPKVKGKFVEGRTVAAQKINYAISVLKDKRFKQEEDVDSRRELLPNLKDTRGMFAKA